MAELSVRLFRKLDIACNGQVLPDINARKVQELFCYLLLHRDRPHHREILASLLWPDSSTAQSKRYLRQALWRLQAHLGCQDQSARVRVFLVDPEWVCLDPAADLWLDVAEFEQTFVRVEGVPGQTLDDLRAQGLCEAVDLYRGDLLEGWFQDWCLYERERLQNMYLAILDKLTNYCEVQGEYEAGLTYGGRMLSYDGARERTHRKLMRLYYLAGDRTTALRQYDSCVKALHRELGVRPSPRTVELREEISKARSLGSAQPHTPSLPELALPTPRWSEMLGHLKGLQTTLAKTQDQLQQIVHLIEVVTKSKQ